MDILERLRKGLLNAEKLTADSVQFTAMRSTLSFAVATVGCGLPFANIGVTKEPFGQFRKSFVSRTLTDYKSVKKSGGAFYRLLL